MPTCTNRVSMCSACSQIPPKWPNEIIYAQRSSKTGAGLFPSSISHQLLPCGTLFPPVEATSSWTLFRSNVMVLLVSMSLGVLRDTAHAPQPPTNPPIGHYMSRQGLAQNDQKCQFWDKFSRFGAKNPNFHWRKQKFWYPLNGKTT